MDTWGWLRWARSARRSEGTGGPSTQLPHPHQHCVCFHPGGLSPGAQGQLEGCHCQKGPRPIRRELAWSEGL